jgi:peroxiredoxin
MVALLLYLAGGDPGGNRATLPTPQPAAKGGPGISLGAVEPAPMQIQNGDPAPDFSYQSPEGRWRHLHDLLVQGNVLVVFGAPEATLRTLERERDELLNLGVVPVAVLDVKPGSAWSAARKMDLRYTVLADPRRVIGAQFNVVDGNSRTLPAWFVVDRKGTVRGSWRGELPQSGYTSIAARSLSLPLPSVPLPASR